MSTENAGLIGQKQVAIMLGVKTRTLGRWVASGKIPKPLVTSGNRKYWAPGQLTQWLSDNGIKRPLVTIGDHRETSTAEPS